MLKSKPEKSAGLSLNKNDRAANIVSEQLYHNHNKDQARGKCFFVPVSLLNNSSFLNPAKYIFVGNGLWKVDVRLIAFPHPVQTYPEALSHSETIIMKQSLVM